MGESHLRFIPAIKELQDDASFKILEDQIDRVFLTKIVQNLVEQLRTEMLDGRQFVGVSKASIKTQLLERLKNEVSDLLEGSLQRVINATGVVLHTNLGRARLGEDAVMAIQEIAGNYSSLEYDLSTGKRGSRHDTVEALLSLITGAEAAMVVNNNAAAVFLILRALGKDQEVIVSRGELVEIGGSFRVSSIMEESDAQLVEVGTTNKTHLFDYEQALTEDTAMILKVHKSNFAMSGFTEEVSGELLAKLAKDHNLIFYEDLGSGAVFHFSKEGVGNEPIINEELTRLRDLVSASGDKLFGGPQAGIILGKKVLIDQLKQHQLARVLRVDKMTLAALNETLKAYLLPELLPKKVPTVEAICRPADKIKKAVFIAMEKLAATSFMVACEPTTSRVGGGTLPTVELASFALTLQHPKASANWLADRLRKGSPPIVATVQEEKVWFDFRTLTQEEHGLALEALKKLDGTLLKR